MTGNRIFLALVHYPIYNKNKEVVTTSITNLDIHDISRCAATYDLQHYYLVHPHQSQQKMAGELLGYWTEGFGAQYNQDRCIALSRISIKESLEDVKNHILSQYDGEICLIVTDAHKNSNTTSYKQLRKRIELIEKDKATNFLLIFGTGYGLTAEIMDSADVILEPVIGRGDYNHLSVRSAASIIIDRLLAPAWYED